MLKNSVIYRGSISYSNHPKNYLKESIKILREWFDGEVIVSTWKNQEKHLLGINGIDKVVCSDDPGNGPIQNFKRQLISYEKGLEHSSGDYLLITRTDFIHKKNIFSYQNILPKFNSKFKLFEEKILIGNMMSINPSSNEYPNTYRLSDWFHLGNKKDIENWGKLSFLFDKIKKTFICTEKTWFVFFLIKNGILDVDVEDTKTIDSFFWDFVVSNFIIKNTRSTLESYNMNWESQPENLNCYITEEIFNKYYNLL